MGNIVYNEDELKALGMGDYVFNAGRAVDSYLQQGMLSGNRLDSDPVSAGISRNLGDNYGGMSGYPSMYDGKLYTNEQLVNQAGSPTVAAANLMKDPDGGTGFWDGIKGFNYGGTKGSTGLGGAIGAGLGIGQLGLGVMQYLDAEKTNKLNRELMNQQIVSNKDTYENRLARRAQIQKDWGPQQGIGAVAPKVG